MGQKVKNGVDHIVPTQSDSELGCSPSLEEALWGNRHQKNTGAKLKWSIVAPEKEKGIPQFSTMTRGRSTHQGVCREAGWENRKYPKKRDQSLQEGGAGYLVDVPSQSSEGAI